MDLIFKEGMLHLQAVKFGKKTWRKVRMVLFKPSSTGVGRLEFCTMSDSSSFSEHMKPGRQKTTEKKVVRLSDCLSVTPAARESCPAGSTAFYVHTMQSTYTFASTSSPDWISALCLLAFQKDPGDADKGEFERGNSLTMADNDLYSSWKSGRTPAPNQYRVKVQTTEASKRCKLSGEYLVSTEKDDLVLSDISGGVVYCWPYRLLRKFGHIEGGFSIEAGRRCDSGEGVFVFLTQNGTEIFQTIAHQCSVKKDVSVQYLQRTSVPVVVPPVVLPAAAAQVPAPPALTDREDGDTEDRSVCEYSTISVPSVEGVKHLSLISKELMEEGEDEEERCHSLDALDQERNREDSIYYNLRRASHPSIRETQTAAPDCTYSFVGKQTFSSDSDQCVDYKPFNLQLSAADDSERRAYGTQEVDDMKEDEDATGSPTHIGPKKALGSFKHRLAEIISKDMTKFQPPFPYGTSSPTVFQ
uniref:Docking protein 3 n=3 Tax=Nothobranchius korthausae TaxID=1143690 RepID=A0A1A8FDL1_9TELE